MRTNQVDIVTKVVLATFEGFLKYHEFKKIAEDSLALVLETGYSKILVDTSKIKVIQKESQDWINNEWFPKAINAGVTHMAFLIPQDFFGKMSVESTNKHMAQRGDIEIQYFTDAKSARRWLRSKSQLA
ncbi:STAS/SEC14 domain-containing protein [Rufibacter latericius]|uniref:STAS/SEC14 domain-containing protein n=1 Tax=Rufibacter latericius TaxID=2487040 RepID=A0A3M9MCV6_9BACT|nr:STAS/SEC14 domain-containing protein [Rufibacter latericius]RNI23354.1 hypothetical protein EFB08_17545 [Rufibacter latericius]